MKFLINHQTAYKYDLPVRRSTQYLRLSPQSIAHQRVLNWRLAAASELHHQTDGFGNILTTLTISRLHQDLLIMAQGEIEIADHVDAMLDDRLAPELFAHPTALTSSNEALKAFSARHLKRLDRYGLIELSAAILDHMPYTSGATHVMSSAVDAFELRQGVCQDHTHVLLACARQQHLAARYVSGYFYAANASHLASHAWAEVWLDGAWYCFDVSNQLFTPSRHVQIAVGRDYLDAAPVRGVRQGGGNEAMTAMVQVLPSMEIRRL